VCFVAIVPELPSCRAYPAGNVSDTVKEFRQVRRALRKDRLNFPERVGECIGVAFIVLMLLFFLENQVQETGFFTSKFGSTESFLFYGSALFGVVEDSARALIGRRNPVRPLEVIGALFWALASYWFLQVFPFDFAHFPDLLPDAIKFLFWWLTNYVARLILLIGVVAGLLEAIYTTWLYVTVRRMQQSH
jgi:hypothetical protein